MSGCVEPGIKQTPRLNEDCITDDPCITDYACITDDACTRKRMKTASQMIRASRMMHGVLKTCGPTCCEVDSVTSTLAGTRKDHPRSLRNHQS
mmetsp:Transcript_23499/g.45104  ORF Transcript_23499/g.45104 Transcript_23499/m.45104 type:complete len:93 (-) Transcript_23499:1548-1826(-)